MVRIHPDPPLEGDGAVAQLGERLLCKQEAVGSIPSSSTNKARWAGTRGRSRWGEAHAQQRNGAA